MPVQLKVKNSGMGGVPYIRRNDSWKIDGDVLYNYQDFDDVERDEIRQFRAKVIVPAGTKVIAHCSVRESDIEAPYEITFGTNKYGESEHKLPGMLKGK